MELFSFPLQGGKQEDGLGIWKPSIIM